MLTDSIIYTQNNMKGNSKLFFAKVVMKVYCHGFECCENGLLSYKGLNVIEDVDEVVIYNEKGRLSAIFEKVDYEAVAIFAPTTFVIKKDDKYIWSEVMATVKKAETIDNLENGQNYAKDEGIWVMIESF